MLAWTILILGSVTLGALTSFIKWRFAWLIIFPVPPIVIHLLNRYYDSITVNPHKLAAANNILAYFYVGVPAIVIALVTYYLIRHGYQNKPSNS